MLWSRSLRHLIICLVDVLGEKGKAYIPYLITVILYIGMANIAGIFGFKPPTKDLNVTAALAIMSIVMVQVVCIRSRGPKGWLKSFAEPVAIVAPINVMELVINHCRYVCDCSAMF